MDLSLIPFLLFVVFIVIRITKEASKVTRKRPGADDLFPDPQPDAEGGARDISDFLKELKRMHSSPPPPEVVSDEKTRELRDRVRAAARQNREKKLPESLPPIVAKQVSALNQTVEEEDYSSASAESAYSEKTVKSVPGGLAHPVFSGSSRDPMTMARRAIILQEVLGPPLGLR